MTTASTDVSSHDSKVGRAAASVGWVLVLPIVLLVLWWMTATIVDSAVFPDPFESFAQLGRDLGNPGFQASILSTVRLLVIGWTLAVVVGTLVGFALGLSSFWSAVFATPLFALYSIPKITLYPVFPYPSDWW